MLASAFNQYGGPEVLELVNIEMPSIKEDEVLVKVLATSINPSDILQRTGKQASLMTDLKPPYIPGMEFSGVVEATGAAVKTVHAGQMVMGLVNPRRPGGGSHAQFIGLKASSVVPVPQKSDIKLAAAVAMSGLTALMVLDALNLPSGSAVLVTGGAGVVGGYVISLATHRGLKVIADAKPEDSKRLRDLGVGVLVPRGPNMLNAVMELYPYGVDGAVDAANLGDITAAAVKDSGAVVTLRKSTPITDPRVKVNNVQVFEQAENNAKLLELADLFANGILRPRIGAEFPLSEAQSAHVAHEMGGGKGRIILVP